MCKAWMACGLNPGEAISANLSPSGRLVRGCALLALPIEYVIPRQRHRVDPLRQLHLEAHQPLPAERDLGADEIHFPHPAEALVIDLTYAGAITLEAIPPCSQRVGVMQTQDFEIGNPKVE